MLPHRAVLVRGPGDSLEHLASRLAGEAGAGLVAGFNCVPPERLEAEIGRVFGLTRRWQDAGLATIHLEMSGFADPGARDRVLEAARGAVTSVGMSQSEFLDLDPRRGDVDPNAFVTAMTALATRLNLDRLCVHADQWAVSATRGNPDREYQALMASCLVASARAAAAPAFVLTRQSMTPGRAGIKLCGAGAARANGG